MGIKRERECEEAKVAVWEGSWEREREKEREREGGREGAKIFEGGKCEEEATQKDNAYLRDEMHEGVGN